MSRLSTTLSGITGVYLVAAELSRRGFIASVALGNSPVIDILASDPKVSRPVALQVKTNQQGDGIWLLDKEAENQQADNLFYVFVDLRTDGHHEFYVVPSKEVARITAENHRTWMRTPGRRGQPHKDTPMREFKDPEGKFLARWDLLNLNVFE
jgi:hypothetical protein